MTTDQITVLTETPDAPAARPRRRVHHLLPVLALGFALTGVIVGCGESDLPRGITKKAVAFDEVPETLRTAARKAIPKVDFKEAWQNLDSQGKLHSYEIRGRQSSDGKIREVRVSLTGEILESE
jgi:hypothetical protein